MMIYIESTDGVVKNQKMSYSNTLYMYVFTDHRNGFLKTISLKMLLHVVNVNRKIL